MNILYNTLKSGGIKDHFRQVNVPSTAPYWKACWHLKHLWNIQPLEVKLSTNKNFYNDKNKKLSS